MSERYGEGGLFDMCKMCRFDKNGCPIATGLLDFVPMEPDDDLSLRIVKTVDGEEVNTRVKFIDTTPNGNGLPFVCILYEAKPPDISEAMLHSDSSSQLK